MKKRLFVAFAAMIVMATADAQTALKKVYDENVNPIVQIDHAIAKAKTEDKFVICQVGGNWFPWCLRFADFITNDGTISNNKTTEEHGGGEDQQRDKEVENALLVQAGLVKGELILQPAEEDAEGARAGHVAADFQGLFLHSQDLVSIG